MRKEFGGFSNSQAEILTTFCFILGRWQNKPVPLLQHKR